jgi:hypothetical protein
MLPDDLFLQQSASVTRLPIPLADNSERVGEDEASSEDILKELVHVVQPRDACYISRNFSNYLIFFASTKFGQGFRKRL